MALTKAAKGKPAQIVVEVSGGVVNAIYSSDPTVQAEVLDWDNLETDATPADRTKAKALEKRIKKMTEVL